MTTPAESLDTPAIRDVQNRYGVAIDGRRWADLARCFSAECVIDYGVTGSWTRATDFARWAAGYHDPLGPTLHQMSSHIASVAGESATAVCYVHALPISADGADATHVYARYEDELARTFAGWLIVRRTTRAVWRESASR